MAHKAAPISECSQRMQLKLRPTSCKADALPLGHHTDLPHYTIPKCSLCNYICSYQIIEYPPHSILPCQSASSACIRIFHKSDIVIKLTGLPQNWLTSLQPVLYLSSVANHSSSETCHSLYKTLRHQSFVALNLPNNFDVESEKFASGKEHNSFPITLVPTSAVDVTRRDFKLLLMFYILIRLMLLFASFSLLSSNNKYHKSTN